MCLRVVKEGIIGTNQREIYQCWVDWLSGYRWNRFGTWTIRPRSSKPDWVPGVQYTRGQGELIFEELSRVSSNVIVVGEQGTESGRWHLHSLTQGEAYVGSFLWKNGFFKVESLKGSGGVPYVVKYVTKELGFWFLKLTEGVNDGETQGSFLDSGR